MSIQSTTELTRKEAESRLVYKIEEMRRKFIEAEVHMKTDKEIEDELESTFDNFKIV